MKKMDKVSESIQSLDSLRMRIANAEYAEKAFIRYSSITAAVLVLTAVVKWGGAKQITISVFGGLEVPRALMEQEIWIIRLFFTALMLYAFVEWVLGIIDVDRHPLATAYTGQRSFVAVLADFWDRIIKTPWLHISLLLDFLQKVFFLSMIALIILGLWIL